jgi:tetratricopeptide (TPR) repeat protein
MESADRLSFTGQLQVLIAKIDFQAVAVWMLGFLLVVYLGLNGGGYEPVIRDQIGIAVWWGVLLGLAVGALPLRKPRRNAWVALGAFGGYVAWVALSATWSSTVDGSFADLGRVTTYLGIFALALALRGPRGTRRIISALGAGIFVLVAVGLLSRLHPAWFPGAHETVSFLSANRSRLSYPLGYWNGMAALVAIGLPLVLYLASSAKHLLTQALAAAALPAMALTLYFTFSRGGVAAAVVGLIVFVAFATDRVLKGATMLIAAVGSAILMLGAHQRGALDEGLSNQLAHHQGNELLAMTIVVCAGVGLIQTGLAIYLRNGERPAWTRPSRRTSMIGLGSVVLVVAAAAIALVATGKVSHAWNEFKESEGTGTGTARLQSFSSNGRVPYWEAALHEFKADPIVGGGSGSFEVWWAQHRGEKGGFVRDAHSLYLEALAELGIVGLVLILFFFGWVLWVGVRSYLSASRSRRTQLAAALAGVAAFSFGAAYDWLWELPVLPIAFLLLASVLVTVGSRERRRATPILGRVVGGLVAIVAMVAIAIPLGGASSIQQSQAAARSGDLSHALTEAEDAIRIEPFAAPPRLQKALVLEEQGRFGAAEVAALGAVHREPQEWRSWVVLSRLQAEQGNATQALASYRKAKMLNPRSSLFR